MFSPPIIAELLAVNIEFFDKTYEDSPDTTLLYPYVNEFDPITVLYKPPPIEDPTPIEVLNLPP